MFTLLSESWPQAIKEHRCIWCGEKIKVGETYHRTSGVFEGDFQCSKWHIECDEAFIAQYEPGEDSFEAGQNERPKNHE